MPINASRSSRRTLLITLAVIASLMLLGAIQESLEPGTSESDSPPDAPPAPVTSAKIINARLVPPRSPATGRLMQRVVTTWKNTGTTPVRVIEARFIFRDAAGRVLDTHDYTLYASFGDSVPPGATYTTPAGDGFLYPGLKRAAGVEITIRSVKLSAGAN